MNIIIICIIIVVFVLVLNHFMLDDYEKARNYGKSIIRNSNITNKTAVMFDIDDTLITNYSPIKPIIELCNYAKSNGIQVVIITARPGNEYNRIFTHKQLDDNGIMYDKLFFVEPQYKKIAKQKLDMDFIFSVGDMPTDVDGDYSGKSIKLKNL